MADAGQLLQLHAVLETASCFEYSPSPSFWNVPWNSVVVAFTVRYLGFEYVVAKSRFFFPLRQFQSLLCDSRERHDVQPRCDRTMEAPSVLYGSRRPELISVFRKPIRNTFYFSVWWEGSVQKLAVEETCLSILLWTPGLEKGEGS